MKCNFDQCINKQLRIIGKCKHCSLIFCSDHRLIENHKCIHLNDFIHDKKKDLTERLLASKLIEKQV
jgi:predicted nucleic acid binding AN1-type Zn finger protein